MRVNERHVCNETLLPVGPIIRRCIRIPLYLISFYSLLLDRPIITPWQLSVWIRVEEMKRIRVWRRDNVIKLTRKMCLFQWKKLCHILAYLFLKCYFALSYPCYLIIYLLLSFPGLSYSVYLSILLLFISSYLVRFFLILYFPIVTMTCPLLSFPILCC